MVQASQHLYTISKEGRELEPMAIENVAKGLTEGTLASTDFVWSEEKSDWLPLLNFEPLTQYLQSQKPKGRPSSTQNKSQDAGSSFGAAVTSTSSGPQVAHSVQAAVKWPLEWTVRTIGGRLLGPFSVWGIIKALQEKAIVEFDSVKRESDATWTPIVEHESFNAAAIENWRQQHASGTYPEIAEQIFSQRRHPRIQMTELFGSEAKGAGHSAFALIHNDDRVFEAQWIEASQGGSGLLIPANAFFPGQKVTLHFASLADLPAFNALGEVVSLHKPFAPASFHKVATRKSKLKLGIKYLQIDPTAAKDVQRYFELKTKNIKAIA